MTYSNKSVKEISGYRCPICRQISHELKWVRVDEKGNYQCPECHLVSSVEVLKLLRILIFKRERIWVT